MILNNSMFQTKAKKNFVLRIVLSLILIFGYMFIFGNEQSPVTEENTAEESPVIREEVGINETVAADIESLKASLAEKDEKLKKMDEWKSKKLEELNSIKSENTNLLKENIVLKSERDGLIKGISSLEGRLKIAEGEVNTQKKQNEKNQKEIKKLRSDNAQQEQNILDLQFLVKEKEEQIAKKDLELNDEKTKNIEQQNVLSNKNQELVKLSEKKKELEESLKKATIEKNAQKGRADANREKMRQFYKEREEVTSQLENIKKELERKKKELGQVNTQFVAAGNKLTEAKRNLEDREKKKEEWKDKATKNARAFIYVLVTVVIIVFLSIFYFYFTKMGKPRSKNMEKSAMDSEDTALKDPFKYEILDQLSFYKRASFLVRKCLEIGFIALFVLVLILAYLLIREGAGSLAILVKSNFWKVVSVVGFPFVVITSIYNAVESKRIEVYKLLSEITKKDRDKND